MRFRTPEQLWAISRWFYRRGHHRLARGVKFINYLLHKTLLPAEASVGSGLILEHYAMGLVLHPQVEIGSGCRIYHHVTLASETWIGSPHKIIVEDRVTIGAHSIVVARSNQTLRIGTGSIIGAGSVVTRDIPAGEVWAGNPAKKLRAVSDRIASTEGPNE